MFACSVKVSYASDSATKAVLLKDKPARSVQEDSPTDPLQYIEVGKVPTWCTSDPASVACSDTGAVSKLFGMTPRYGARAAC